MATIAETATVRLKFDEYVSLEDRVIGFHEYLIDHAAEYRWEETTEPLAGNMTGYVGKMVLNHLAHKHLADEKFSGTIGQRELLVRALVDYGNKHGVFRMLFDGRPKTFSNRVPTPSELSSPQMWVVADSLPKALTNGKKRPHSPMTTTTPTETTVSEKPKKAGSNPFHQTPGVQPPWLPKGGRKRGARNMATVQALALVQRILAEGGRSMAAREIFDAAPGLWPFEDVARMPRLLEIGDKEHKFYVRPVTADDIKALVANGVKGAQFYKVGVTLVACAKSIGVTAEDGKRGKIPPAVPFLNEEARERADKEFLESPEVKQAMDASKAATRIKQAAEEAAADKDNLLGVVQGGDDLMARAQEAYEASQAKLQSMEHVRELEDQVNALKEENQRLREVVTNLLEVNEKLRGNK